MALRHFCCNSNCNNYCNIHSVIFSLSITADSGKKLYRYKNAVYKNHDAGHMLKFV